MFYRGLGSTPGVRAGGVAHWRVGEVVSQLMSIHNTGDWALERAKGGAERARGGRRGPPASHRAAGWHRAGWGWHISSSSCHNLCLGIFFGGGTILDEEVD